MTTSPSRRFAVSSVLTLAAVLVAAWPDRAAAQSFANRGFVGASGSFFPQTTPDDSTQAIGELLVREEAFFKPEPWLQFAAGLDARLGSHDQVEPVWRLDFSDRGLQRPRLSARRLATTLSYRRLSVDIGKQFIRWGTTDIVTPTDWFAPRDFLNVIDYEFLPVAGVRAAFEVGQEVFDAVWLPRLTPSRTPLPNQRWSPVPNVPPSVSIVDRGAALPSGGLFGVRWMHTGTPFEYALSFFDGFNHLPNIDASGPANPAVPAPLTPAPTLEVDVRRVYPAIRGYGADAAVPTRWVTVKGELAYVTSSSSLSDEYVLYVVQLERQTGEWVFVGGYAGEAVTVRRVVLSFAPDRGLTRAFVARASYTIDPNRQVALESAIRQNGRGFYAKAEYSQARGQHWRGTATVVGIAGEGDDFIGQYDRNSHLTLALRYSF
jgi:hypothetical protein